MALLLLLGVLGTNYLTSVHLAKLRTRITELENLYNQNEGRHEAVVRDRKETEMEERNSQQKLVSLETKMEDLKLALEDQMLRNKDLSERLNEKS